MIDTKKIAYSICHVPSDSRSRMSAYDNANNNLAGIFDFFAVSTVHLKKMEDYLEIQKKYNFVELKKHIHPKMLMFLDGTYYIIGDRGGGAYENVTFPMALGEIGLFLSAYQTFKRFLETDYEYLIWMEDDVEILEDFEVKIKYYLKQIDFNFDVIALGAPDNQKGNYNPELYEFGHKIFCRNFKMYSAESLLFSRAGIEKVIREIENNGFRYPFDWLVYNVRSESAESELYDAYCIKPEYMDIINLHSSNKDSTIIATHYLEEDEYSN